MVNVETLRATSLRRWFC